MTRKIIFKLPKKFHKKLSLTQTAMALNRAPAVLKEIKELIQKQGLTLPVTLEIADEAGEVEFTGAYRFDDSTSANLLVLVRDKLFSPEMARVAASEKEKFLDILQDDLALPLADDATETEIVDETMPKEKAETSSQVSDKPKRAKGRLVLFSLIEIMFLLVLAVGFKMLLKQNVAPSYFVGIGTSLLMFLGLMSVSVYLKKLSGARRFETENPEILTDYVNDTEVVEEDLAALEADYLQEVVHPFGFPFETIIPEDTPVSGAEMMLPKEEPAAVKEKQPVEFRNNQTVIPIKQHHKNKKQNGGSQLSISKADVTKRELSEHLKRSMSQATTNIQSQIDDKQATFYELCQNISSLEDVKRSQTLIDDIYQLEVSLEAFQNGELIDEAEAPAHAQTL